MDDKDNTQIDLESNMVLSELDHFIAKSQEKSDPFSKEIIAAKSFKIEIEASMIARNNLDQEVRAKIDKARQWLNQKKDEQKAEEDSLENKEALSELNKFSPIRIPSKTTDTDESKKEEDNRNAFYLSGEQGKEQAMPSKKQDGGDAEEEVEMTFSPSLSLRITKLLIPSSLADEDNTQIDQEIQNLVKKLDECIANFDQKRQVLENAIEPEIEALKKEQNESRELRLTLLHESGDTSSNLEARSRNIAHVKQWLNQKALISGDPTGDQDQGKTFSVLIVDDDLTDRDNIRRYTMSVGTRRQLTMEFQEAKNGKEADYLHLAGASFDLIIMDDQMPIMTGIQATQQLREMGVESHIVGFTSESDQQAFINAGVDDCIQKPLDTA